MRKAGSTGPCELDGVHALSTSFARRPRSPLHMTTRLRPDIPVILVDTGYLFPETYRFADELVRRLALNPQGVPADDERGVVR